MNEKEGIVELEKSLKNLQKEKDLYPPKLEHLVSLKEQLEKRISIHERLNPIVTEGLPLIEPKREFEAKPEFWELQKELQVLEHESNMAKMRRELEQLEAEVKSVETELARIHKEIPRVEAQLKEMKGE